MKPYKIEFFVYADSEEEAKGLERDLFDFVNEKRNIGIAVRASRIMVALDRFRNNILVNNFLKQQ